jgi:hypothetical protein
MKRLYEYSGEGSGTTDFFSLPTAIVKVHAKSEGGEHATTSLTMNNLEIDHMWTQFCVGAMPCEEQQIMKVEQSDKYLFEALSNTTWSVWIELME